MELRLFQFVCFGFLLISLESFKAQEITVDSSQTFTSANYPDNYPSNYNETWCFATNSNNRLLLSFVEIEIERKYDFIIVSESTASSGDKQLLRWSGSGGESVPRVLSSGNNLCVYIQTDSKTNEKGFSGIVEAVSDSFDDSCSGFDCKNGVCLGKDDRCNGFVNCGNGEDEMCNDTISVDPEVEFKSMNYDDGGYGSNHHFTWYLTVNDGMRIEVQFNNIDIESVAPLDLISVGNGLDTSKNRLLTWHGGINASTLPKVRSSGSSMWVHFTSDEHDQGLGFSATARRISTQEGFQCDDFNCGNASCIPQIAKCDRFLHCMEDEVEDDQCPSLCETGTTLCNDGREECFTNENRCDDFPVCLNDEDQNGCELTVSVEDRDVRLLRDFSQTINFTSNIPQTQLLINLFFIRTESRNVEVNLTVGENELTPPPLLQRNGIVNDYVLTRRSSGQVLWIKFDVKGGLLISTNVLKEDYNFPPRQSCPEDISVANEDADDGVEWRSPFCNDREDGELVSTCTPSSGDAFNEGDTDVKCTCIDSKNLISTCNFTVTVNKGVIGDVQLVPLLIGLTVVVVLIVLFAAYCLTPRIAKPKSDDELPLNVRNSGRGGGYQNTDVQQDVDQELLTPPYERTVEGSQPQQTMYASIDESPPGGPERPDRNTVDNTQPAKIYTGRIYNDGNSPIPPERDMSPGSSGVEQSPYYSRQLRSKYQN